MKNFIWILVIRKTGFSSFQSSNLLFMLKCTFLGASSGSTNTVIFNPQSVVGNGPEKSTNSPLSPMHTWNPVLERLTGKPQLRNESYYKVKIVHTFLFFSRKLWVPASFRTFCITNRTGFWCIFSYFSFWLLLSKNIHSYFSNDNCEFRHTPPLKKIPHKER